jgi:hypothetical protein
MNPQRTWRNQLLEQPPGLLARQGPLEAIHVRTASRREPRHLAACTDQPLWRARDRGCDRNGRIGRFCNRDVSGRGLQPGCPSAAGAPHSEQAAAPQRVPGTKRTCLPSGLRWAARRRRGAADASTGLPAANRLQLAAAYPAAQAKAGHELPFIERDNLGLLDRLVGMPKQ